MRKYLSTIHQKSPEHKRLFALVISGSVTLIIFGIWSLVTLNRNPQIVAEVSKDEGTLKAPIPLEDIKSGLANSFEAVRGQINSLQENDSTVDTNTTYGQ